MKEALRQAIQEREQEMFVLLRELVLMQSGTANKKGVDQVGRRLGEALEGLPFTRQRFVEQEYGDHLLLTTRLVEEGRQGILLCGHMDTVFPADTDFNWYREEDDRIYGPGVIDMKGGLVVIIGAVQALAACDLLDTLPLMLFFNSDEEIGSPTSIPLLEELATRARCGLVTECGGKDGEVVTGRRGKTGFCLEIQGQAGHAAFAGENKASAILELAHKIIAIEGCNDPEAELVVNVGYVEGGIGPNSIPEQARALVDSRFSREKTGLQFRRRLEKLVRTTEIKGTSARLEVTNQRPVMVQSEANQALFDHFNQQAEQLGQVLTQEFRAGVSDANTLAGAGLPVLDGLGPLGAHDHSDREYMRRDSLIQRTLLLATALATLPEKDAEPA